MLRGVLCTLLMWTAPPVIPHFSLIFRPWFTVWITGVLCGWVQSNVACGSVHEPLHVDWVAILNLLRPGHDCEKPTYSPDLESSHTTQNVWGQLLQWRTWGLRLQGRVKSCNGTWSTASRRHWSIDQRMVDSWTPRFVTVQSNACLLKSPIEFNRTHSQVHMHRDATSKSWLIQRIPFQLQGLVLHIPVSFCGWQWPWSLSLIPSSS